MKSSINRNLAIGFGFSLFILVVSSAASYVSLHNLLDSAAWVNHTHQVVEELANVVSPLKDAEASQRGYLLTDDPDFLEPFNASAQLSLSALDKVKALTIDNGSQQQNAEMLKHLLQKRINRLQYIVDTKKINNVVNTSEIKEGKNYMDQILAISGKMKDEEYTLLAKRMETMKSFAGFTPVLVLLSCLLAVLSTVIFYRRIRVDILEKNLLQYELQKKDEEITRRIAITQNIADRISAGDYSIRVEEAANDGLGNLSASMNKMAGSLEYSFSMLSDKEWLQNSLAQLNESMVGEKSMSALADDMMRCIADCTASQVGALYITHDDLLVLTGSYALAGEARKNTLIMGEGLAGAAALSGKEIRIENISPENIYISFAAGQAKPKSLAAFPIFFEKSLKGVIELGSLHHFTELHLDFLKTGMQNIGIAINTAQNRTTLQSLLEETQAQTEELQSQHKELENMNAEMEVQTEKLQASEEELKVQHEELIQTNKELQEGARLLEEKNLLISQRNTEIQQKAEELALSTKYKSEFLANMSHELRTPLNSILLLSRLLAENNDKNLTPDQVEYARVIRSSGNGLLELIDEILDLSKIEAGKMSLEYSNVRIPDIVDNLNTLFAPLAKQKNVSLDIIRDPNLPQEIETDKLRLEQVLRNLLSNAIKFTSNGFVYLEIAMPDNDRDILFTVRDSGIGISKEKQGLIFEAFQQEDGSTRRKYGGTGLGLSISREIVKLLGGKISVVSEPGSGSAFTVSIPRVQPVIPPEVQTQMTAEIIPAESAVAPAGQRNPLHALIIPESIPDDRGSVAAADKVILIVEDDIQFAKALMKFARGKQYKVIVAVRGDEAIILAQQYHPIGILLDIQLPVKNGWEVMEQLKKNPATKHIPVHIMSSLEVKKESLLKGAVDFINKPVAFEQMHDIFAKIEYVLNSEAKKVMIVEENTKHAKALAYFLGTFAVRSEISNTIEESIQSLHKNEVDCVILDIGIPDARAYEMIESVKKNEGLENVPIIMFTGKNLSRTEEVKIRQFADSIVVKTAHSYQRILDEVSLFLHLVDGKKSDKTDRPFEKLGAMDEVLKNKTVLVADDDVRNIYSMTKALEKHKMKVLPAVDGTEALGLLQKNPHADIILMDMMMPEMDGYETIQKVRAIPAFRTMPIIAVTAKAMTGDREKCIRAGASDYISKPVDIDQLISLLRIWLYEKGI